MNAAGRVDIEQLKQTIKERTKDRCFMIAISSLREDSVSTTTAAATNEPVKLEEHLSLMFAFIQAALDCAKGTLLTTKRVEARKEKKT